MKIFKIIPVILALLLLVACDNTSSTVQGTTPAQENYPSTEKDLTGSVSVQEYTCVVDDSFAYYVLFVTNTSDITVRTEMNVIAKDQNGNIVGAQSDSTLAIAPGQTSGMWTTFDEWDTITDYEYSIDISEETTYTSIHEDVAVEYNIAGNKVVAAATNNGNKDAYYVWMDVVFLKEGKMVGFSEISLMSDTTLLAGKTISGEGELFSDTGFDDIAVAVNGRI